MVIELRRPAADTEADAIEATLAEMVVAHRVVIDDGLAEPVLADGDRIADDAPARSRFIDELTRDLADWSRFQSDACYIADDGGIC